MEEEHAKAPSHNNPEEAAEYVRSVTSLTDSFDMSIRGFDRYLCLEAWQTFIHALSELLIKLDSAYFTKLDKDIILETIPDKACDVFLARPEEAAVRVQQHVSSDEIPEGSEVMSKMRLQNLPCFDRRGQQAVTRLFTYLQDAHNYLAEVARQIVMVSEVSSPEQFTFVLQHAVRPIIQLKIPPHLSAPTELKFEKERLTPKELNEENCCNLILPRPFHPKFTKLDTKDPTRCLAAAAHFLIRKKLFNSKVTQLRVAKDFAVAEKKLHLAISGRKYDPGKKASKRKLTSDVKTADPQPSTSKDESTSKRLHTETVSEQQPEDTPIAEQHQESEAGSEQQTQDDSTSTQQMQDNSTSTQQMQDDSTSTQQTQDDSTSTLQSQDESIPEQKQQHASDTLTSLSSEDSHSPLPDYGSELKMFSTKDPRSIPKKLRYSLHPKPD